MTSIKRLDFNSNSHKENGHTHEYGFGFLIYSPNNY